MKRKSFEKDERVEVVPDALGSRGARPTAQDWKPATYVRAETGAGRGWHVVQLEGEGPGRATRLVPMRRIRKAVSP